MEERQSILRGKRELTPKITSTKMTISKSTPFFITKHHLDDTQMRSVLNYNYDDRTLKKNQRARSQHAEFVSCAYSKVKEPFSTFQHQSNLISRGEASKMEYYGEKQDKFVQVEIKKQQERIASNEASTAKAGKRKIEEPVSRVQESKRVSSITQTNDYCLQEGTRKLEEQRKIMRQTQRVKESNKKKVARDLRSVSKQKVKDLNQEIRQIKIKHLEIERERLMQQYAAAQSQRPAEPILLQASKKEQPKSHFDFHYSITNNKPRFRFKQSCDSDSSFSSFELE